MNFEMSKVGGENPIRIRNQNSGRLWSVSKQTLKRQYQNKKAIKARIYAQPLENRKPISYCTEWVMKRTSPSDGSSLIFQLNWTKDDLENVELDCADSAFSEKQLLDDWEDCEVSEIDDQESCYREIQNLKSSDLLPLYACCVNGKFFVRCQTKSKENEVLEDDPRIFTFDYPYLKHKNLEGNEDNNPIRNFEYYVSIKKTQQECVEISQQECGEPTQQECGEPTQQECGEPTQQECGEPTQQECGEPTQQECGEPTQQECGEPTQQEYGEPTQQECGEPTQQGYGEPTQQECGEPTQQEYGEPTQQGYGEPTQQGYGEISRQGHGQATQQEYGEATQQRYGKVHVAHEGCGEPTQQKYGEVAHEGYGEATQQECGEFSLTPVENDEEATSYLTPKLILVKSKDLARKWVLATES